MKTPLADRADRDAAAATAGLRARRRGFAKGLAATAGASTAYAAPALRRVSIAAAAGSPPPFPPPPAGVAPNLRGSVLQVGPLVVLPPAFPVRPGQQARFSYVVLFTSGWEAPLAASWRDRVYLASSPAGFTHVVQLVGDFRHTGPIPPDRPFPSVESYGGSGTFSVPAVPPGDYYLILDVDYENSVPEWSEADNSALAPLEIGAPL